LALALLGGAPAAQAKRPVAKKEVSGQLNINTATAAQFDELPGISRATAARIIEARAKAPFRSTAEVAGVRGVGKRLYEHLKPYLTVSGATTLTVHEVASAAR
jgi:competence protein ComEA